MRKRDDGPFYDLATYEGLIAAGVAAADARNMAVDHVTARRLAIWLAARPQERNFTRGLVQFTKTGEIARPLKAQLRVHARSGNYTDQPQAARLMQYCIARSASVGPISENFGAACDQMDRADLMLMSLQDRKKQGQAQPTHAWPEVDDLWPVALANRNPETGTVSFAFDATTANAVMFAVKAQAAEREAHIREVERYGQTLPEGSYGRRNREAIAARETRITTRLRAVGQAYSTATERGTAYRSLGPTRTLRAPELQADREIALEAEP